MREGTVVTDEGCERLRRIAEYEAWGYDGWREAAAEELGAEPLSKGHVYTVPCIHENRRHFEARPKGTYVLKVCSRCLKGEADHGRGGCFLDNELGVWAEARRRGDDELLCPIVGANRREGWMLMEHCGRITELSDVETYDVDRGFQQYLGKRLQARGWLPSSVKRMDIEPMAFKDRPVAIDYEKLYHDSWQGDPLRWSWAEFLRQDATHTAAARLAISEHDNATSQDPQLGRDYHWKKKQLEDMHFSETSWPDRPGRSERARKVDRARRDITRSD